MAPADTAVNLHDIDAPAGPAGDRTTGLAILQQRFGDRFSVNETQRRQHANTLTWVGNLPPDAVIWVESTQDVADVVSICATHGVPIIPFGAGTSLEGHVNAPRGGVSLDFSGMDQVLEVNERDLDCVVQAGVSRKALNEHLRDTGLFFPVDPGAEEATIGGMAATRASGTNAVRYGTMRDNVLNLTAVMADGSIVKTGQRARKSSAGYDLTRLLVGSEGTLGIITELTVRVYGVPEVILAAVCPFKTLEGACNAAIQAIQLGLGIARIELLDEMQIYAVNQHSKTSFEQVPTLFLEFHGTQKGARDQVEQFEAIAKEEGAVRFDWASREEDRRGLWKARHDVYWAVKGTWPAKEALATDVCVPISRLAECVTETQKDVRDNDMIAPIVGHVGDGNFHCSVVVDMDDPADVAKAKAFTGRLVERALAMEGTCTGEHGIGHGKIKYMAAEHGAGLQVMKHIKTALDPQGLLNPGKILPDEL
ncbi:MAG: FAD-linked oxidase C-terminal domain-containing protein [Pseudomonadota bacterium]